MKQPFKLEHVGQEEDIYAENEVAISGFGPFTLTGDTVEYHFREEEMSLEKAEAYIGQTLNNLSKDTIDDLCHKMCTFIARVFDTYPNLNCTSGLAEAKGNDILPFISASDIYIYRNPYNDRDNVLGANIIVGLEWDYEDGVELNVKGSEVLSVTQYLGYGEFGIWDEDENST
jgi:hypothetical protein